MKYFLFLLLFFSLAAKLSAQSPVEVIVKQNDDKTVDFNFQKNEPGSYTLTLRFSKLNNSGYHPRDIVITSSMGSLFTLRPIDNKTGISYSYTYRYIQGICNPPKLDTTFVYLLPHALNSEIQVIESFNIGARYLNHNAPKGWKAYYFKGEGLDSVFAVRKGVVINIVDKHDFDIDALFTTERNLITIEHPDGSKVTYKGFAKGKIAVEKGDEVLPHTFLGSLKNDHDMGDEMLSLMMFYLSKTGFEEGEDIEYTYFTPIFYTSKGVQKLLHGEEYIVSSSDEIVTKEMSRKEKKKYRK